MVTRAVRPKLRSKVMVAIPICRPRLARRPNLFGEKIAFAFAFEQPAPRSDGGELRDDELARLWQ